MLAIQPAQLSSQQFQHLASQNFKRFNRIFAHALTGMPGPGSTYWFQKQFYSVHRKSLYWWWKSQKVLWLCWMWQWKSQTSQRLLLLLQDSWALSCLPGSLPNGVPRGKSSSFHTGQACVLTTLTQHPNFTQAQEKLQHPQF